MRISSEWLRDFVQLPPADELAHVFEMAGLGVENRQTSIQDDGEENEIFSLEVTSNRGDCLSAICARRSASGSQRRASFKNAAEPALPGRQRCPLRGGAATRSGQATGVVYISIFEPSSTTALFGRYRKSAAPLALWCICAKSFSRQAAMPLPRVGMTVSRERK